MSSDLVRYSNLHRNDEEADGDGQDSVNLQFFYHMPHQ